MSRAPSLVLPPAVRRALISEAHAARPRECCGFLIGRGRHILWAAAMPNVATADTRYRIDDAAHIAIRRTLRAFRPAVTIVGVYHSHPAGRAQPSATDLAEALYPEWTYVIVGLGTPRPDLRGFQIRHGRAREVSLTAATRIR